jgi:DNA mismatch repair protein MSH6
MAPAARTPAKGKAPAAGSTKQRSIASFFQKSSPAAPASSPLSKPDVTPNPASCLKETTKANTLPKPKLKVAPEKIVTPVPSSDVLEPPSSQENMDSTVRRKSKSALANSSVAGSSPTRKAKKVVTYAESSDEEPFAYSRKSAPRRSRTRSVIKDEDEYDEDEQEDAGNDDEEMDDFVVSDESDENSSKSKKRKRPSKPAPSRKRSNISSPADPDVPIESIKNDFMDDVQSTSTTSQWKHNPESTERHPVTKPAERAARDPKIKEKA